MYKYDFLIVGAGLFGSICARLLSDKGYKVLIIEKDSIVGGLAKTKIIDGITIHLNGVHILYTNDSEVWNFVNKYSTFKELPYYNEMIQAGGRFYKYPLDLNTLSITTKEIYPDKIKKEIFKDTKTYGSQYGTNLEEWLIKEYGFEAYSKIEKPFQEKKWNKECKYLSPYILELQNNRYKYNDTFYTHKYVGIPIEGYTKLVENIIGDDIDIMLNTDYFKSREIFSKISEYTIFTGPIDKFCQYVYGPLDWNCLKFELKKEKMNNLFGTPVLNISDKDNGLLQIIEHQLLNPPTDKIENNYISYVYPDKWDVDNLYDVYSYKNLLDDLKDVGIDREIYESDYFDENNKELIKC